MSGQDGQNVRDSRRNAEMKTAVNGYVVIAFLSSSFFILLNNYLKKFAKNQWKEKNYIVVIPFTRN